VSTDPGGGRSLPVVMAAAVAGRGERRGCVDGWGGGGAAPAAAALREKAAALEVLGRTGNVCGRLHGVRDLHWLGQGLQHHVWFEEPFFFFCSIRVGCSYHHSNLSKFGKPTNTLQPYLDPFVFFKKLFLKN
jgi:hypothetical protein